jgi:hypothetical protein
MCLLSPRGTLEKWVSTTPAQARRDKRERGLCGAHRHWAGRWLGPTRLFSPQLPRAHGPYISRKPTCRFHCGHWCQIICGDPMGSTNLKKILTIVEATGTQTHCPFFQPWKCTLRGHLVTHEFSIYQNVQCHWWTETCQVSWGPKSVFRRMDKGFEL